MSKLYAVLMLLATSTAHAITHGTPTEVEAVAGFGLASSVEAGGDWFCSAVLVRPDAAVIARHCIYPLGSEPAALRFRLPEPGTAAEFYAARVASFYVPEYGDAAIAYLTQSVPHIEPMAISFESAPVGQDVLMVGYGRTGDKQGAGQRELRECITHLWFAAPETVYFLSAWAGATCGPNAGDSGGPIIPVLRAPGAPPVVAAIIDHADSGTGMGRYAEDPHFNSAPAARTLDHYLVNRDCHNASDHHVDRARDGGPSVIFGGDRHYVCR